MDREKAAAHIFDQFDISHKDFLNFADVPQLLQELNEKNRKIVKKNLENYQKAKKTDSISRKSFIELMIKKNCPIVVHVNLGELLEYDSPIKQTESFVQRLKKRLKTEKCRAEIEEPCDFDEAKAKDYCNDEEHCEKPKWKSAKERNLEELIAIRRCHLLYS